jgi:hypothetical protein
MNEEHVTELIALKSIYGTDLSIVGDSGEVAVTADDLETVLPAAVQAAQEGDDLALYVRLTAGEGKLMVSATLHIALPFPVAYPAETCPCLHLSTMGIPTSSKLAIEQQCQQAFEVDEPVIYEWTELVQDMLDAEAAQLVVTAGLQRVQEEATATQRALAQADLLSALQPNVPIKTYLIHSGQPFVERKSIFVGHVAAVHSLMDVQGVMHQLLQDRKLQKATHNIMAYRFFDEAKNCLVQDNDEDGENAAGGRLAEMLQLMDVRGACVIVTRWYGGVKLGPSRFGIINNVARQELVAQGFSQPPKVKSSKKKKQKRNKHRS